METASEDQIIDPVAAAKSAGGNLPQCHRPVWNGVRIDLPVDRPVRCGAGLPLLGAGGRFGAAQIAGFAIREAVPHEGVDRRPER